MQGTICGQFVNITGDSLFRTTDRYVVYVTDNQLTVKRLKERMNCKAEDEWAQWVTLLHALLR